MSEAISNIMVTLFVLFIMFMGIGWFTFFPVIGALWFFGFLR